MATKTAAIAAHAVTTVGSKLIQDELVAGVALTMTVPLVSTI
jgi:hypothetical protein